jgi:hypothetical protein
LVPLAKQRGISRHGRALRIPHSNGRSPRAVEVGVGNDVHFLNSKDTIMIAKKKDAGSQAGCGAEPQATPLGPAPSTQTCEAAPSDIVEPPPLTFEALLAAYRANAHEILEESHETHRCLSELLKRTQDPHDRLELLKLMSEVRFKQGKITNAALANLLRLENSNS